MLAKLRKLLMSTSDSVLRLTLTIAIGRMAFTVQLHSVYLIREIGCEKANTKRRILKGEYEKQAP